MVRCTVEVDDPADLKVAFEAIHEDTTLDIARVKNNLAKPI